MPRNVLLLALPLLLVEACSEEPETPTATQNAQMDEMEAALDEVAREQEGPDAKAPDPPQVQD